MNRFILLVLISNFVYTGPSEIKVSIITSIYKCEKFIDHFLLDMVKQTIFDQCELILVDANSPENESAIIENFIKNYSNIIYIKLNHDPGLYTVWNLGIKTARGKYITNANTDDRLAYNCYETFSNYLDSNPDVDLVYSDSIISHVPNETFYNTESKQILRKSEFSLTSLYRECLPSFNPMWRKNLHNRHGLFDESFKIIGDWEMWLRAAAGGSQLKKLSGRFGLYYDNPIGLTNNKVKAKIMREEKTKLKQKYKKLIT